MRKRNLLLAITNGIWLIDESSIGAYAPIIANLLNPKSDLANQADQTPAFYSLSQDGAIAYSGANEPFSNSAPLSTAVISITGPIMKYDNCGDAGTITYGKILKAALANPNIGSIVIEGDSPGGEVSGTEDFANIIASATKPVLGYVNGLSASAFYWILSQTKEVYASNLTDRIGSIGTMLSFADAQGAYEKLGYKFHEVYAPDSTDKNKDYIEARKGNYDLVKKTLGAINDVFKASVIKGRGDKLNQKETLSGKVFMAQDAIEVGLIDGIKSFDDVVMRAQELAREQGKESNSIQSNTNQINPNMKIKATWLAVIAALTPSFAVKADDQLTDEMGDALNAKLEKLAETEDALQTAIDAKTALETNLTAKEKSITDLTAELNTAKADFAEFKKSNPGATETIANEGSEIHSNEGQAEIDGLAHNKALDEHPIFGRK